MNSPRRNNNSVWEYNYHFAARIKQYFPMTALCLQKDIKDNNITYYGHTIFFIILNGIGRLSHRHNNIRTPRQLIGWQITAPFGTLLEDENFSNSFQLGNCARNYYGEGILISLHFQNVQRTSLNVGLNACKKAGSHLELVIWNSTLNGSNE